jgi:hypothetical protein
LAAAAVVVLVAVLANILDHQGFIRHTARII